MIYKAHFTPLEGSCYYREGEVDIKEGQTILDALMALPAFEFQNSMGVKTFKEGEVSTFVDPDGEYIVTCM
tara:strand:+ start:14741 stop:14953 length:213 start_codon:yes stop_codon:yes gene_type:complete